MLAMEEVELFLASMNFFGVSSPKVRIVRMRSCLSFQNFSILS